MNFSAIKDIIFFESDMEQAKQFILDFETPKNYKYKGDEKQKYIVIFKECFYQLSKLENDLQRLLPNTSCKDCPQNKSCPILDDANSCRKSCAVIDCLKRKIIDCLHSLGDYSIPEQSIAIS